jgi:hypothetical protein
MGFNSAFKGLSGLTEGNSNDANIYVEYVIFSRKSNKANCLKSDFVQNAVAMSLYVIFASESHCTIEALYTTLAVLLSCSSIGS